MLGMIFIPLILNALDYTIINGKKEITMDTFRKMLHRSDIVYIGETHTSTFSHSVQLEVIRMMYEKNKKICVGFEMLNKTLQPWLDKYLTGEISEDEFLNGINWEKEWGFDFSLYRPIFSFVKDSKLKALALNLPRRVVSKVARGGIDALSEDEKKLMAKNIKVNKNRRYKKYLENTFYTGDENPMNKIMTFENYTLSMAVWNETMGERVAEFINLNPGYSFVVIAGNGHIIYNAAIPWSVRKRTKKLKHLSIYTAEENEIQNSKDYYKWADIIVVKKSTTHIR